MPTTTPQRSPPGCPSPGALPGEPLGARQARGRPWHRPPRARGRQGQRGSSTPRASPWKGPAFPRPATTARRSERSRSGRGEGQVLTHRRAGGTHPPVPAPPARRSPKRHSRGHAAPPRRVTSGQPPPAPTPPRPPPPPATAWAL